MHTKGPWSVYISDVLNSVEVGQHNGNVILAKVYARTALGGICSEQEANAHLIAAAPDLLAACKRMEQYFATHVAGPETHYYELTEIRLAIAKAEFKKPEGEK